MGQCCKCGRETEHAYDYYEGEAIVSHSVVTYDMELFSGFICDRCVWLPSTLYTAITSSLLGLAGLGCAIYALRNFWLALGPLVAVIAYFVSALYSWIALLRDKRRPRKSSPEEAAQCMIEIKRGQTPEKVYFTPLEYEKHIGGITP